MIKCEAFIVNREAPRRDRRKRQGCGIKKRHRGIGGQMENNLQKGQADIDLPESLRCLADMRSHPFLGESWHFAFIEEFPSYAQGGQHTDKNPHDPPPAEPLQKRPPEQKRLSESLYTRVKNSA